MQFIFYHIKSFNFLDNGDNNYLPVNGANKKNYFLV